MRSCAEPFSLVHVLYTLATVTLISDRKDTKLGFIGEGPPTLSYLEQH